MIFTIYPFKRQYHKMVKHTLPPENIRKPYGFLMFLGGRKRVLLEQMG